jgi:hypothetical protein
MTKANINYWRLAPGEHGFLWAEQKNNGCVAVGWSSIGDLGRFKADKEAFEKAFYKEYSEDYKGKQRPRGADILWRFYKEVKRGHKMLINSGQQIFAVGTITGGYDFNENLYYSHSMPIRLDLNFWEPANARTLGLPNKVEGKICGKKPTITPLEPDDWEDITKGLDRVRNPFKGISEYEGFSRSPQSEQEVIVLFSRIAPILRMKMEAVGTRFPDALIRVKKGGKWVTKRCEFEKRSSDFWPHIRRADECDMIICWEHNWKELDKPKYNHIKIVELRTEVERIM